MAKARYTYSRDQEQFALMSDVIQSRLTELKRPGVLSIRPGYKAVGGWPTRKTAIVVTVAHKRDAVAPADMLPTKIDGFAVDVRQASPVELLRVKSPTQYSQLVAAQHEYELPVDAFERDPVTGRAMASDLSPAELAGQAAKPRIDYTSAAGVTLNEVNEAMSILCHASPDAGWPELKKFFAQVKTRLTVGIYDFTSQHVLDGMRNSLVDSSAALTVTIDHPAKNPTADQTDEETIADLEDALKAKLQSAWALVRASSKAPQWIYPSAYHIKVAVSDGSRMWLSSGNWNNSNQPDIDPVNDPPGSDDKVAKHSDRDWHVIVDHDGLAHTYEAFLVHDFEVANAIETGPAPLAGRVTKQPSEIDLSGLAPAAMAGQAPARYFPPRRVPNEGTKRLRVQPILTPDNYCEHVLPLIGSAKKTFYMQTQYIHPTVNAEEQQFADLINAVAKLQHDGLDVRLILSQWQVPGGWLDRLQAAGIDLATVKIQNGVHNKGIIVDSEIVMLGSQNWSGDGVLHNRDASLIIYDADAAQYFEDIFLHDWTHMASQTT